MLVSTSLRLLRVTVNGLHGLQAARRLQNQTQAEKYNFSNVAVQPHHHFVVVVVAAAPSQPSTQSPWHQQTSSSALAVCASSLPTKGKPSGI